MNPIFRDSCLLITAGLCISVVDGASVLGASHTPALSSVSEWLSGAAEAMGGEAKLRTLASVEMSVCPCDITRAIETSRGGPGSQASPTSPTCAASALTRPGGRHARAAFRRPTEGCLWQNDGRIRSEPLRDLSVQDRDWRTADDDLLARSALVVLERPLHDQERVRLSSPAGE